MPTPARPAPRRRTRLLSAALGAAAAVAVLPAGPATAATPVPLSAASAAAAAAAEVYRVPADRVLKVRGHGYGHGRGLSQWGAQGAALLGVPASTILDTYYPGTLAEVRDSGSIRVALTRAGLEGVRPTASGTTDGRYECDRTSPVPAVACRLEVLPAAGLTARIGTDPAAVLPTVVATGPVLRWRVLNDDAGMHLQHLVGTAWTTWGSSPTGPVLFDDPSHVQQVRYDDGDGRDDTYAAVHAYRGTVSAVRVSATRVVRVNTVPLEDYLLSVVPKESPPSWQPAALQAQSVAARSYATHLRTNRAGRAWEICDSTSCQVYAGRTVVLPGRPAVGQEQTTTTAAVRATAGQVRTYRGAVVRAEFGSSSGGFTTSGGVAWLPAQADPWDAAPGNTSYAWSADLPAAALEARFGLGRLDALAVLTRRRGRRVGRPGARRRAARAGPAGPADHRAHHGRGRRRGGAARGRRRPALELVPPRPAGPRRADPRGLGERRRHRRAGRPHAAGPRRGADLGPGGGLGAPTPLSGGVLGAPALVGPARRPARGVRPRDGRRGLDARPRRRRLDAGGPASAASRAAGRPPPGAPATTSTCSSPAATAGSGSGPRARPAPGRAGRLLGGTPAPGTGPAAVATGTDRLDVVVHDAAGGISWRRATAGSWGAWTALGGDARGRPRRGLRRRRADGRRARPGRPGGHPHGGRRRRLALPRRRPVLRPGGRGRARHRAGSTCWSPAPTAVSGRAPARASGWSRWTRTS